MTALLTLTNRTKEKALRRDCLGVCADWGELRFVSMAHHNEVVIGAVFPSREAF